jgi:GAF domain-containing protein
MLIRENLPGSIIGLVLPLHARFADISISTLEDLPTLGTSLIGWLSRGGSSYHTLFTDRPTFRYPTDYCLLPLAAMRNEKLLESPKDNTLIILERLDKRSGMLSLDTSSIKLIQRLLAPLYEEEQMIRTCFGWRMHDEHELSKDLSDDSKNQDSIMEGIADMIIHLGGHAANGRSQWRFCHIMLPEMTPNSLPLQQRSLVTRAQSKDSPFIVGESIFTPQKSKTNLSIRAFQSGRVIYRPELSLQDRTPTYLHIEGPIRSNIAIPIGAENGQPVAVLYVTSNEPDAFSREDQQLLRIIGRLIENLLSTYSARLQVTKDLRSLLNAPDVVDTLFGEFLSENDFMRDVEALLMNLDEWLGKKRENTNGGENRVAMNVRMQEIDEQQETGGVVSFIAIEMDDQESLASQYGDQIMRYLNKTLGLRIQEMIAPLTTKSSSYQLYYMYASRFYLVLRGISLKKACEKAEQFRVNLSGSISLKQSEVADSVLILPDISVHLAVTSYSREKCEEFLQEYSSVSEISVMIGQTLDAILKMGIAEGGDVVMAWNPKAGGFGGYRPLQRME